WGGMGLYLAEVAGCDVTGVTLSEEQHKVSNRRAEDAGLNDRVRFKLQDYRDEAGQYDRIVSVGMFEHVGAGHYLEYFRKVRQLLKPDGVMLLHSIGRMEPPGGTNPWLRKYIFPGGYTPALSETLRALERAGLWVTDIEILRLHYAKTLREWRRRFNANRARIEQIYDERFGRMWDFYLAGCEVAFRHMGQMVFQMQITREQTAVPLTRDYMVDWERERMSDQPMANQSVA
ncbi:MAG: cyclopropane-fatty-acyl-phospholipid synthase family protein, partial [Alphaproteobacteria bacterium]